MGVSRRPRTGFKVLIFHLCMFDLGRSLNPTSFGFYTFRVRMLIISDAIIVKTPQTFVNYKWKRSGRVNEKRNKECLAPRLAHSEPSVSCSSWCRHYGHHSAVTSIARGALQRRAELCRQGWPLASTPAQPSALTHGPPCLSNSNHLVRSAARAMRRAPSDFIFSLLVGAGITDWGICLICMSDTDCPKH